MSEVPDFEEYERELNIVEIDNPIIVAGLLLGEALLTWKGLGNKPDKIERCLTLMFITTDGQRIPIILHPDSKLIEDFMDLEIYYRIKHFMEKP